MAADLPLILQAVILVIVVAILVVSVFGSALHTPADFIKRGNWKDGKGDYDGAIADYTKAIQLNPNGAVAYYNRGRAKYNQGDYDNAIADFTKAIELDPKLTKAYNNRGTRRVGSRLNEPSVVSAAPLPSRGVGIRFGPPLCGRSRSRESKAKTLLKRSRHSIEFPLMFMVPFSATATIYFPVRLNPLIISLTISINEK